MKEVNPYNSSFCFQCNSKITFSQQFCSNCGARIQPWVNFQSRSYRPIEDISLGTVIVLIIFLGILSALGYILWVRNPYSVPKKIVAVILILLSIVLNLVLLSLFFMTPYYY
ncbi:MAG: hypothetical protein ACFFD1_11975 [Candidatus Thorarchaeota archaeon]